jgi:prevent-host-death family protein
MRRQTVDDRALYECYDGAVKTVSALDVRRRFGQLLDEAAAGERIVIERAGIPLAALVPLGDLAGSDPGRVAERQLAALAEVRRLVAEAPPAPAGWDAARFVRSDRDRDRDDPGRARRPG